MEWLTNLYNPELPEAKRYLVIYQGETQEEMWDRQLEWLKDKIIGEPKATKTHSVERLKADNIVGVYKQ